VFSLSLHLLSETFFILSRSERDMIRNAVYRSACHQMQYIGLRVTKPLFLSVFNETWIFSTVSFSKNTQTSNLMKIRPVGVGLLHAGRRTDRHDESNSRFSQFCKRA
jgi:hypothetical protein